MSKECSEIQKKFNYLDGLRLTKLDEIKKIEVQIKVLKELFPEAFPDTEITDQSIPLPSKKNSVTSVPSAAKKEKKTWDKTKKSNLPKNIYATPDGKYKIVISRNGKRVEKWGFTTVDLAVQARADILEQLENNPDREPAEKDKKYGWQCRLCGGHIFSSKPEKPCSGCNRIDYEKVQI